MIFFSFAIKSKDLLLICKEKSTSYDKNLSTGFVKIINLEEMTLSNFSGSFFDNVILFTENEIITDNKIFNTRSTFNIHTNRWTTYKGQFIKIYKCTREKRR